MAKLQGFPRAIVLGALVMLLMPFITGWMPDALAIPLVAGLDVAGVLGAGIAVFASEFVLGWLKL